MSYVVIDPEGNFASGRMDETIFSYKVFVRKDQKSTMLPQASLPFTG